MEVPRVNANIGRRLRELRLERGLQQAEVARLLGVSPAYLNLIEKGKRMIHLPMVWQALRIFEVDVEEFMATLGSGHVDEGLAQLLDEPLVRSLGLRAEDLASFSTEPRMVATITALFNLYKHTRGQLDALLARMKEASPDGSNGATNGTAGARPALSSLGAALGATPGDGLAGYSPFDEITDFLEHHRNWFPELEEEARRLRRDHQLPRRLGSEQLVQVLEEEFGLQVKWAEPRAGSVVRRFDAAEGLLTLSPTLLEQPLKFQLAVSIGLRVLEQGRLHERLAQEFGPRHAETARLIKIHLANYFGGALLLPYEDFHREVQRTRYDVEHLSHLFGSSYETIAHRICNLADPRLAGVPMHFLRVDVAGNISKRYSATGLRIPQNTGSCPKWAVHNAFLNPFAITKQYSRMPDGTMYFCFAKVLVQPDQGSVVRGTTYSIGLGVRAEDAHHLAYAQELPLTRSDQEKMAIAVGPSCRFCERTDCNQRAAPSYKFAFVVDENIKKDNFFSPLTEGEKK
ncbi:MAG TPA: short-chain fatty acyl-CoA regulator family protein [Polyangia bacterium]|jgi:hypothetical protein|nr:short-chain fatty acyl-CoA regulator family protein [Polyangia bacterium]